MTPTSGCLSLATVTFHESTLFDDSRWYDSSQQTAMIRRTGSPAATAGLTARKTALPPLRLRIDHTSNPINWSTSTRLAKLAQDERHPLSEVAARQLRIHATHPLNWHVATSTTVSRSSCVRNWARRRVQSAFKAALRERGWDEHGRVLDQSREFAAVGDLKGWVRINVDQPVVESTFADVKARAAKALQLVIQKQPSSSRMRSVVSDQGVSRPGASYSLFERTASRISINTHGK
ncbi:hypothetical protein ANO11243_076650 [Dothideomycetidae sp. 11243]|nr:hypothetical protein ANO11243_076650 [fungal sp. No.11243]